MLLINRVSEFEMKAELVPLDMNQNLTEKQLKIELTRPFTDNH